jgi:hypothetical protein
LSESGNEKGYRRRAEIAKMNAFARRVLRLEKQFAPKLDVLPFVDAWRI